MDTSSKETDPAVHLRGRNRSRFFCRCIEGVRAIRLQMLVSYFGFFSYTIYFSFLLASVVSPHHWTHPAHRVLSTTGTTWPRHHTMPQLFLPSSNTRMQQRICGWDGCTQSILGWCNVLAWTRVSSRLLNYPFVSACRMHFQRLRTSCPLSFCYDRRTRFPQ